MDLKQLQAMGAIVTRSLFKREIEIKRPVLKPIDEWADPEVPEETGEVVDATMTVHIRKRASADFLEMVNADDRDKAFVAIHRCVCAEDGAEVFESVEQARQLAEWMFVPLAIAVNEVNQFGEKKSQPKTSSGANSPASSGAPLKKQKSGSAKRSDQSGSPTGTSAAP